jgi:hypothetical protein
MWDTIFSLFWDLASYKEILQVVFNKHDHEVVAKLFLNSKKCKWSLENYELSRYHDIIHKGCGKFWKDFEHFVKYDV